MSIVYWAGDEPFNVTSTQAATYGGFFSTSSPYVYIGNPATPGWVAAPHPSRPYTAADNAPEVDLVPGALRGYRQWGIGHDGRLSAVTTGTLWRREMKATCWRGRLFCNYDGCVPVADGEQISNALFHPTDHESGWACDHHVPPVHSCTCGIYAKHQAKWEYDYPMPSGVIEAWGKIEVGTQGFRAQHARILGLWLPSSINISLDYFEEKYQVPVYDNPVALVRDYPPIDVGALLARKTNDDTV